mmetsp:Transcript_93376/g.267172  ORF Transcript_93376/g.267172 Transcript_93376/m.267172 type:complete len:240 (-) Transcript_93376:100-819(-)
MNVYPSNPGGFQVRSGMVPLRVRLYTPLRVRGLNVLDDGADELRGVAAPQDVVPTAIDPQIGVVAANKSRSFGVEHVLAQVGGVLASARIEERNIVEGPNLDALRDAVGRIGRVLFNSVVRNTHVLSETARLPSTAPLQGGQGDGTGVDAAVVPPEAHLAVFLRVVVVGRAVRVPYLVVVCWTPRGGVRQHELTPVLRCLHCLRVGVVAVEGVAEHVGVRNRERGEREKALGQAALAGR